MEELDYEAQPAEEDEGEMVNVPRAEFLHMATLAGVDIAKEDMFANADQFNFQ